MVIRFLLILVLVIPLVSCKDNNQDMVNERGHLVIDSGVNKHRFDIEIVTTVQDMARGLMHRTEMAEDAGMLFDFSGEEVERAFWMKNTLIPLDILFIKNDGTIHHIHENAIPHDLTSVPSRGPVGAVLELNGGIASKLGLQKGDKLLHQVFQ